MAIMLIVGIIAVHVVLVILVVMIYEICSILQAQDRARSASVNPLNDCDAPEHYVPSSEPFPTRRRLQHQTLQIGLPNREVDEFEHFPYGELSSANIFRIPSMTDGEINALPVHNCTGLESENAPPEQASSSSTSASALELLCNICLEPIMEGDRVCCFPSCIHKIHFACLDKWRSLSTSCPVCDLC